MKKNRTLELVLVSLVVVLLGFVSVPRFVENQKMARVRAAEDTCELLLKWALENPNVVYALEPKIFWKEKQFYMYSFSDKEAYTMLNKNNINKQFNIYYTLYIKHEEINEQNASNNNIYVNQNPLYIASMAKFDRKYPYSGATPQMWIYFPIVQKDNQGNYYGHPYLPYFEVSNGLDSFGVIYKENYGDQNNLK